MLARVLLVLLAGVPVCPGLVYSDYYNADGGNDEADFSDSYNDEIKAPPGITTVTDAAIRIKRRQLDIRTLNPEEIFDVKGALNSILRGKTSEFPEDRPVIVQDNTNSYDYLDNSNVAQMDEPVDMDGSKEHFVFKKWLPTEKNQDWSPMVLTEQKAETTNEAVNKQRWIYMHQTNIPSYSRKNDVIAQIRKLVPVFDGEVTRSSSVDDHSQSAQTWTTADYSDVTQDNNMVYQETTVYSNSEVQAEVKKLVPHWNLPSHVTHRGPPSNVQHWNPSDDVQHENVFNNIRHWNPSGNFQRQNLTDSVPHRATPSNSQHWNPSNSLQHQTPSRIVQYQSPAIVPHRNLFDKVQHWSSSENISRRNPPSEVQHWNASDDVLQNNTSSEVQHWNASDDVLQNNTSSEVQHWNASDDVLQNNASSEVQHWNASDDVLQNNASSEVQHWNASDDVLLNNTSSEVQHWSSSDDVLLNNPPITVQHWNSSDNIPTSVVNIEHWTTVNLSEHDDLWNGTDSEVYQLFTTSANDTNTDVTYEADTVSGFNYTHFRIGDPRTIRKYTITTTPRIDIDAILEIISNLTEDYEWNLTEQFNKSLIQHGFPTCAPIGLWGPDGIWTATTPAPYTTDQYYDFENTSVVSKCFVCGLKTTRIPRDAFCADAFAGDFLPLMPVDARSRGKIASYRKYCRHLDVYNYVENSAEPRAIYGRFTGGCAVRWTDITGVYTQRTCRSKYRPLMGKHFASKRMAKLELALVNVEDGCIISPMATLLPVSRGISLYARFHACVCSTNWCNTAAPAHPSLHFFIIAVLACWLSHYT